MLTFKQTSPLKGKIVYDQTTRAQFDKLRNEFRVTNDSARFARQFAYQASQFKYAITPLGSYNIGMTVDFLAKCKELGIKYSIEDKLKKTIRPDLCIDKVLPVPNETHVPPINVLGFTLDTLINILPTGYNSFPILFNLFNIVE